MRAFKEAGLAYPSTKSWHYYNANSALKKPRVKAYIKYLLEKKVSELGVTVEWVVSKFRSVYDEAMATKDFGNANKALENLAKYLGMFIERKEEHVYNYRNEAELDRELARLLAVAEQVETNGTPASAESKATH